MSIKPMPTKAERAMPLSPSYDNIGTADEAVFVPHDTATDFSAERLGVQPLFRITSIAMFTLVTGTLLGFMKEQRLASLRHRAENAHRMPRSEKGWFFYKRSEVQYGVAMGMMRGPKLGLRLSSAFAAFSVTEATVDYARGDKRDFISTVVAALSCTGLFCLISTAGPRPRTFLVRSCMCADPEQFRTI
jgi:hypothetical protein